MSDEIIVHPEYIRKLIGEIGGVALAVDAIPNFLKGKNNEDLDVHLTSRDLGDLPHFIEAWAELCEWREEEVKDLSRIMWYTARALAYALADYTNQDEEIAAGINAGFDGMTQDAFAAQGLQLPDSRYYVHGDPDDSPGDITYDATRKPHNRNFVE